MRAMHRTGAAKTLVVACVLLFAIAFDGARGDSLQSFMGRAGDQTDERGSQGGGIQSADMLTQFRGAGKYDVLREEVEVDHQNSTSKVFIYKPVVETTGGLRRAADSGLATGGGITGPVWPGVVFGHGLCTSAKNYEHLLTVVASWGYVVFATVSS